MGLARSRGRQQGDAAVPPGRLPRDGDTGGSEQPPTGCVVVMVEGEIREIASILMGVPLEVGGGSGSRPADPARRTDRVDPLGGGEPRGRSKGSPV
jgi:hypothetical protein